MIPHFKKGDFDKLKIPVPTRAEQEFIGDFYFKFSERIENLRETNNTLEAIARALFKSWFVDFDPVRAKLDGGAPEGMDEATAALFPDGFEESELGLVPRGWSVGTLGDLAALNPESWTAKNHPDIVAYIDLANAKENEIAEITDYLFQEAPSRARRVLRQRDTIVGTVRPGSALYGLYHDEEETIASGSHKMVSYNVDSVIKNESTNINLGYFCTPEYADVSAVIFSSLATWGKVRAVADNPGALSVYRTFHPNPGSLLPIMRVAQKADYQEHLLDGLCVFHNPFAKHKLNPCTLSHERLAQAFVKEDGELDFVAPNDFLLMRSIMSIKPVTKVSLADS